MRDVIEAGDKVDVLEYDIKAKCNVVKRTGTFQAWGVDYEENDVGVYAFSTAIVSTNKGVENIDLKLLDFTCQS